jgi:hypothetical protein
LPDPEPPEEKKEIDFAAEGRKLANKILTQIEQAVNDVKALVVFTAAVHPDAQIDNNLKDGIVDLSNLKGKVTAMASTRIEIDGDISAMIPAESNAPEIRQQLMELHRENLALAQENVKRLLNTLLTFVEIGASIANVSELQDLGRVRQAIDHRATISLPTPQTLTSPSTPSPSTPSPSTPSPSTPQTLTSPSTSETTPKSGSTK